MGVVWRIWEFDCYIGWEFKRMVGLVNWRVEMLGRHFSRLEAFGVFVERVGLEIGDLDGVNGVT
jgi:hypothetical protein